jgi:hypothetical protein
MSHVVRRLGREDLEPLLVLLRAQTKYFGVPIAKFPVNLVSQFAIGHLVNFYLSHQSNAYQCFGCFDGDRLLGTITADYLERRPEWILRRIVVDQNIKGSSDATAVAQALMIHALEFGEQLGYYQHRNLIPAKYRDAHLKFWGNNPARVGRYEVYQVEFIPAGERPRFAEHWEQLFGRVVMPVDSVVRVSMLKQAYRSKTL